MSMSTALGSVQPQEFAEPDALYGSGVGRCICQETIRLNHEGEWVHYNRSVWCR